MGRKTVKIVPRWQPLPEGACTMQEMVIPEVDDFKFNPDDMSKEEMKNLSQFIDQSNATLKVENMVIERYLARMDPKCLAKINQILEAAAVASQKAERTAHLGGGPSSLSINKETLGSRLIDDYSSDETSRSDTTRSSSRTANKVFFGMADKGPKVQPAQKIEMVNREIDELKNILDAFRQKSRQENYQLKCRYEEASSRLQEIIDAQSHFETKLLIEGIDPITGKLSGEKFIRYLETKLKAEETEIDKMRIKTGSLKAHLKKVMQQLVQKEELGETLHAVDFEQLQIENRECQELFDEKSIHVNRIKRINGRYGTLLNVHRKRLNEQVKTLAELEQITVVKDKMIKKFSAEEEKVNAELETILKVLEKISTLKKTYTVPELMEYIKKKSELFELKKEIKIRKRKMNIKELVLAGHQQKLKALGSKGVMSSALIKTSSSIFF